MGPAAGLRQAQQITAEVMFAVTDWAAATQAAAGRLQERMPLTQRRSLPAGASPVRRLVALLGRDAGWPAR
jgi:hypothetical protein